jgi:hypothetical protein
VFKTNAEMKEGQKEEPSKNLFQFLCGQGISILND